MITLNNIQYAYTAYNMTFNLHVNRGEKVVILGPSGAGKSTLLNLIAGFIYPIKGQIILNDEIMTKSTPAFRPVSMLFQENNVFPHLTVRENINLGLTPKRILTKEQQEQVNTIAQQVGLFDYLDRLPSELSGGQRQRIAIARCLIRNKPILLLDEPFSSLDPALRLDMLTLVNEICEGQQITMMMVSHQLEDALKIANRVLVIDYGQILYDGNIETLIAGRHPASQLLGVTINQ